MRQSVLLPHMAGEPEIGQLVPMGVTEIIYTSYRNQRENNGLILCGLRTWFFFRPHQKNICYLRRYDFPLHFCTFFCRTNPTEKRVMHAFIIWGGLNRRRGLRVKGSTETTPHQAPGWQPSAGGSTAWVGRWQRCDVSIDKDVFVYTLCPLSKKEFLRAGNVAVDGNVCPSVLACVRSHAGEKNRWI